MTELLSFTPITDTTEVIKFAKLADKTETAVPVATIAGVIAIKPYRKYRLIGTAAFYFKLSIDGTGVATSADILVPALSPIIFFSEKFNTLHCDVITSQVMELTN